MFVMTSFPVISPYHYGCIFHFSVVRPVLPHQIFIMRTDGKLKTAATRQSFTLLGRHGRGMAFSTGSAKNNGTGMPRRYGRRYPSPLTGKWTATWVRHQPEKACHASRYYGSLKRFLV